MVPNRLSLIKYSLNVQKESHKILDSLGLFQLWEQFSGQPFLVGALAYGLALAPDIDMEIYFLEPRISDGFEVLKASALKPGCTAVRFRNEIQSPDMGYYWQVRYQSHTGQLWKIDMWSVHSDHPGPTSRDMIVPMKNALDEDRRMVILELKHTLMQNSLIKCPSIYLYQAVISDGVRTMSGLEKWMAGRDITAINDWRDWLV